MKGSFATQKTLAQDDKGLGFILKHESFYKQNANWQPAPEEGLSWAQDEAPSKNEPTITHPQGASTEESLEPKAQSISPTP